MGLFPRDTAPTLDELREGGTLVHLAFSFFQDAIEQKLISIPSQVVWQHLVNLNPWAWFSAATLGDAGVRAEKASTRRYLKDGGPLELATAVYDYDAHNEWMVKSSLSKSDVFVSCCSPGTISASVQADLYGASQIFDAWEDAATRSRDVLSGNQMSVIVVSAIPALRALHDEDRIMQVYSVCEVGWGDEVVKLAPILGSWSSQNTESGNGQTKTLTAFLQLQYLLACRGGHAVPAEEVRNSLRPADWHYFSDLCNTVFGFHDGLETMTAKAHLMLGRQPFFNTAPT
jgi:hypothetical protein